MSTAPSASPASTRRRSPPVTRLVSSSTRSGRSPNRLSGRGRADPSSIWRDAGDVLLGEHLGRRHQAPPGARPAPRRAGRSRRRRSCRRRRRPAAAGASGAARRGRPRSRRSPAAARRSARTAAAAWKRRDQLARRRRGGCRPRSRSIARLRSTSTSCTRSSSSKASRRRARSLSAIDSGRWISRSAAPRSIEPERGAARPPAPGRRAAPRAALEGVLDPAGELPRRELDLLALRVDRHDAPGAVADQVDDRVGHLQPTSVRVDLAEQRDLRDRA